MRNKLARGNTVQKRTNPFLRPAAFLAYAVLVGTAADFTNTAIVEARLDKAQKEWVSKRTENNLEYEVTLNDLRKLAGRVRTGRLSPEDVSKAGPLQWALIRKLFNDSGVEFKPPYIDFRKSDFIGEGFVHAAKDKNVMVKLIQWKILRKMFTRTVGRNGEVEKTLRKSIVDQANIKVNLDRLEKSRGSLHWYSLGVGVFAGALVLILELVGKLVIKLRNRLRRPKEEQKKPEPRVVVQPQVRERRRTDTPVSTHSFTPPKKAAVTGKTELLEEAKEKMAEVLGEELTAKVIILLDEKLSNRILSEICEGDFRSLVKLIDGMKKAFEQNGVDPGEITALLVAEDRFEEIGPRIDEGGNGQAKRRKHPLDEVNRYGWKPSDFIRELEKWGFEVSGTPGGGGHCAVAYKGKKIRGKDGRLVLTKHRTSVGEIRPGMAADVLKRCADFLVELEDKEKPK